MDERDAAVVRSVLAGNRDDYRILVQRYEKAAAHWASSYVKDPSRAEGVVQEAFVEAYFQLDRLRRPEQFGSWLRSIVTYAAIAWLRRRKPVVLVEELNSVAGGPQFYDRREGVTPHDELERRELEVALHMALDAISSVHRQVITLFYFEAYSHQQIADLLDLSTSAVKSLLHRARQQLKKEMPRHGR